MKLKKAAMFCLEARIKKLCHTGLDPVSHALNNKHAAMFGLDARIALAIFGALSVISGAALYSAIQNAKATALLADLREVGKAWEQYYLDTGTELPRENTDSSNQYFNRLTMQNLVEDPSIANWSGPYLPYKFINTPGELHLTDGNSAVYMFVLNDTTWGGTAGSYADGYCEALEKCFVWAYMYINNSYTTPAIQKLVDEIVDNGDGADNGNLRWANGDVNILLKIAPVKNPLD